MSLTVTDFLPQVTSLESQLSSVVSVLSTATGKGPLVQNSRSYGAIMASLSQISYEQVLATATAEPEIASASSGYAVAQSLLSSYSAEQNLYGMFPSFGGNLAVAIVMGLLLLIHSGLGVFYHTWWFGVSYFCGSACELAGYVARTVSANDTTNLDSYLVQIITLTIGPVFIMAGVYYLLAQLIMVFGESYALMRPMWYTYIFLSCDLISLVIQAAGGGLAASSFVTYESADNGTNIMVGGIAFQVVSMSAFIFLFLHFLHKISYFHRAKHQSMESEFSPEYADVRARVLFQWFPLVILFGVLLVMVRCIYRVVELAEGWNGYSITHEIYFMILEALMISLTLALFVPFQPGIVTGRHANIAIKGLHSQPKKDQYELQNLTGDPDAKIIRDSSSA